MLSKFYRPNMIFVILLFSTLGMISLVFSRPQSPHGGTLKKAGDYYIEMKNADRLFNAYLLTKKLKPINTKDIFGVVKFHLPDSTDIDIQLKPFAKDGFSCESPVGFYSCKITFNVVGTSVSAQFANPTQIVLKK